MSLLSHQMKQTFVKQKINKISGKTEVQSIWMQACIYDWEVILQQCRICLIRLHCTFSKCEIWSMESYRNLLYIRIYVSLKDTFQSENWWKAGASNEYTLWYLSGSSCKDSLSIIIKNINYLTHWKPITNDLKTNLSEFEILQ